MFLELFAGRFNPKATNRQNLRGTGLMSAAVAQVEVPYAELTRAGRRFIGGNNIIANGIAPVQAIPTTTATLVLWNGESTGGKSYDIDVMGFWLGSGTAAAGATLMATVTTAALAAPTAATGYTISSASGSAIASKARFATSQTIASGSAWVQVASSFQLAAANVGQGDQPVYVDGRFKVPPQYALGIVILSGAGTTPLYGVSVGWNEVEADLE
jgi:hypothetical protein